MTGNKPNKGKTGTINSQVLAQAACRKWDRLKKLTQCEDSQERSIGMGWRESYNSMFKTEDQPQWRNKCWIDAYIAFKDRRACVWKLYFRLTRKLDRWKVYSYYTLLIQEAKPRNLSMPPVYKQNAYGMNVWTGPVLRYSRFDQKTPGSNPTVRLLAFLFCLRPVWQTQHAPHHTQMHPWFKVWKNPRVNLWGPPQVIFST